MQNQINQLLESWEKKDSDLLGYKEKNRRTVELEKHNNIRYAFIYLNYQEKASTLDYPFSMQSFRYIRTQNISLNALSNSLPMLYIYENPSVPFLSAHTIEAKPKVSVHPHETTNLMWNKPMLFWCNSMFHLLNSATMSFLFFSPTITTLLPSIVYCEEFCIDKCNFLHRVFSVLSQVNNWIDWDQWSLNQLK